ncbi:hypothetical protein M8J77_003792 [Diaphorina citri]|nr:hypothetical protein M8J77_003792 [Diaphorina citri]
MRRDKGVTPFKKTRVQLARLIAPCKGSLTGLQLKNGQWLDGRTRILNSNDQKGRRTKTWDWGAAISVPAVGGDIHCSTATTWTARGGIGNHDSGSCTAICWQGETFISPLSLANLLYDVSV